MQAPNSEAPGHPAASEMFAQLSASQQLPHNRNGNDSSQHLAGFLQQQGALPAGMNLTDPAAQAHVFHFLSQISPQVWGGNLSQSSNSSQTLETLLAHISRQPELAASLPSLLGSITGQQQPPQIKSDGSAPAQLDAGQGSYTAQLYGNQPPGSLAAEVDTSKLEGSGDLGAADQDPSLSKANSVKCAKEKNRQAQRRFRERQKGIIQDLKERAETLQKQVETQTRQIETLEKENQVLKVILQEKNKT